jgi:hypothetical protein
LHAIHTGDPSLVHTFEETAGAPRQTGAQMEMFEIDGIHSGMHHSARSLLLRERAPITGAATVPFLARAAARGA